MILELMQRQFLSEASQELLRAMRSLVTPAGASDAKVRKLFLSQELSAYDLSFAVHQLARVPAEIAMPLDGEDAAYFAPEALSAQVQSLLQRHFMRRGLASAAHEALAQVPAHPISEVRLSGAAAGKTPAQLFAAMSPAELASLASAAATSFKTVETRRLFQNRPAPPQRMASNARVFLLGDWGSGVARARRLAERMRAMLLAERAREQHVIHLGDVYCCGWPEEYDDHFLQAWPVRPGEEGRCASWALNSNHDMFSQGSGYFEHLLKDPRFARQAGSSFFSLASDDWQWLGLDSASDDEALAGDQAAWVELRQREHPDKKLLLMSHHQPFSAFWKDCPALHALLMRNRVTGWFWGHEHRLAIYEPRPALPYGRLIGHGGVPTWAPPHPQPPPAGLAYVGQRGRDIGGQRFALFGFAVLDFDGPRIRAQYVDEDGEVEWSEVLQ